MGKENQYEKRETIAQQEQNEERAVAIDQFPPHKFLGNDVPALQ